MKFENKFKKQMVHEWTEAYMDYNGLRGLLRQISSQEQIKNSRASSRHSKLKSTFDCTSQSRNRRNMKDIENQVGDIDNGSGKFVKSAFRMKCKEMSEIEVTFFRKLDEELDKVNSFYKENVEAAVKEASLLNRQMETLIALQRKIEVSRLNGSCSKRHDSCIEISTIPSRSTLDRPCSSGREHTDLALEMDANDKHDQKDSDWGPEPCRVDTVASSGELVEEKIVNDYVKVDNVLNSSMSMVKGAFKKSKKDEQRKMEDQLRKVFSEFHQKLHSLKQYSFMNLSAFSRIMKKYDKILSMSASRSYMEIVDNTYLGSSDEVSDLMKMVEVTFIKNFSNSNYTEGIESLRPKVKRKKLHVTFLSGFLSGCTVALLVETILRIESQKLLHKEDGTHYMESIFRLYSLFGYIVLHMLMYAADIYFWRHYRVNYPFIFGFKRGNELGYQEVFLLGTGLAVLASASFRLSLYFDMDPSAQKYRIEAEKVPLGITALILLVIFCPFKIVYHSSRLFFIHCIIRYICTPLCKVKYPEYFLADQLTSQVQAARCVLLYICYYGLGEYSREQSNCHARGVYNILYVVIPVIPFWMRFLQCIRRLLEEKDAMQGYNALKYLSTIVAVLIRTACELRKGIAWMVLALVSSAVALLINTYWDIVVDWGLLQKHSKNKYLRDRLLVSNKSVYFAAMILNMVLRIAWMQLVLAFNLPSFHKVAVTASVSCLEIIRRGVWNFFSLENEHLNNVNKYRAFKSVPLPFSYSDDDDDDKDD